VTGANRGHQKRGKMKDKRPHPSAITLIHKGLAANKRLPRRPRSERDWLTVTAWGKALARYLGRTIDRSGSWGRTQTIEFGNLRLEHPDGTVLNCPAGRIAL